MSVGCIWNGRARALPYWLTCSSGEVGVLLVVVVVFVLFGVVEVRVGWMMWVKRCAAGPGGSCETCGCMRTMHNVTLEAVWNSQRVPCVDGIAGP
jgi:hypothetical protein